MLLIALCGIMFAGQAMAEPVSRQQALQNAQAFLQKKGKKLSTSSLRRAPSKAVTTTERYYVFNVGEDEGYVIAAGDDRVPAILGYADKGSIDMDAMPENMKAWLEGYAEQIRYLQEHDITTSGVTTVTHGSIAPMLTTQWGQSDPYNQSCPDFFSYGKTVTGCVATAMAQVMYYHRDKSVTKTTASIPSYTCRHGWITNGDTLHVSVDAVPAGSVIDWDNMLDNYKGTTTAEQKKAVADLMFYCGAAVSMDYANSANGGSGAYSKDVPTALKAYFNYSYETELQYRSSFSSDEEWENLIYNELSNHRPVFYSGRNSSSGHAFVCDGYDGNGYYHINWGWTGTSDGYFLLTSLTPDVQDIGGSNAGYNDGQAVIINAVPRDTNPSVGSGISFADARVKLLCVQNWDTDGDGELSEEEAAAVTDLGEVFKNNSTITSFDELKYFTGLKSICDYAFSGCSGLTVVTIPENVEMIGRMSFYYCSGLKSLYIPKGVQEIKLYAFEGCENLESITVDEDNTVYDSHNNSNAIIEKATKKLIIGCSGTQIPSDVTSIGMYAFFSMSKLVSITIPSSVKTIEQSAFSNCYGLSSITIPANVSNIGVGAFYGCRNITSIIVDAKNTNYDSRDNCNAIIEKSSNTLIAGCKTTTIPTSVTTIGAEAFAAQRNLTTISIPESVTSIGRKAFEFCSGLTSIVIPNSVISIGSWAFWYCSNLESVSLPSKLESIESGTFSSCKIDSIFIPSSVNTIGDNAFAYNKNLKAVKVEWTEPLQIPEKTFYNSSVANATLYVPKGSKSAYEAADYWKEFKEIVEIAEPNELNVEPVKIMTGKEKSVSLNLNNEDEIIMVEFELQLPDGFEIAKDEDGELMAELNSERIAKSHTLEVADHGNGKYKFLLYSTKNAALKGNSGELINLTLTCGSDVAEGSYEGRVFGIVMSDISENAIYPSDFTFGIEVIDAIPGDVNGDEVINGLDIVKIVGYIMGSPTQPFIEAAADLNEDEVINGLDLVKLVSLVLAQSSTQSAAGAKGMRSAARIVEKELLLDEERHGMLRMGTADADRYILSQFTIVTDGSISINDITTDDTHVVAYRQTGENRYAVVCYSQTNAAFTDNSDIMKIHYTGNGSIRIQDAMMVDENENEVRFGTATASNEATGIDGIVTEKKPADIYTLGGKLVKKNATTTEGLPRGTYIVNGQKIIIK